MQATVLNVPESLEEDELLRLPATWEEYLDVVDNVSYTIQFIDGEIIGSQANADHEMLVALLGYFISNYYNELDDYVVLGSNIKVAIGGRTCDVNADLSVVKMPIDYGDLPLGRPEQTQFKNPEVVVDILSKSTRKFDLTEKLSYYKMIPSLQHILFVDQVQPFASVYSRTNVPDEWLNHDYRTLESTIRLGALELPMSAIYRKVVFGQETGQPRVA